MTRWNDMPHKMSPKRRAEIKQAALAELDRMERETTPEQLAQATDVGEDIASRFADDFIVVRPAGS